MEPSRCPHRFAGKKDGWNRRLSLQLQTCFFGFFIRFLVEMPFLCTSVLYVALPLFVSMAALAGRAPASKLWGRGCAWRAGFFGRGGGGFCLGVGGNDGAGAEVGVGLEAGFAGDWVFFDGGREWGGGGAREWGAGEGALGLFGVGGFFIFARECDQPGSLVSLGAGGVG